jgi:hypothetical protein
VLPIEDAGPFAALVIEEPPASEPSPSSPSPSPVEIEVDGVVVRLAADAPAARVAEIAAALRARR